MPYIGARIILTTAMIQPRYWKKDLERLRRKYRVGQRIETKRIRLDGEENGRYSVRKWYTVAETYPHIVRCMDDNGISECFGYIELERIVVGGDTVGKDRKRKEKGVSQAVSGSA